MEQGGEERARYGQELIPQLAMDLTERFGRGFGRANPFQMRSFFLAYPIIQTLSGHSEDESIGQTVTDQSAKQTAISNTSRVAAQFPLPWSHCIKLLSIADDNARKFYEQEALRGGWSVRQLKRQIDSQFY